MIVTARLIHHGASIEVGSISYLARDYNPVAHRYDFPLSESGPWLIVQRYACDQGDALIGAVDGQTANGCEVFSVGTDALQIDEARRLDLGRRRLHAPMTVRKERIAIRIEEIRRP